MDTLRSYLLATRPKTLPAAIVPVWVGCALAWKMTGGIDPRLALFTVLSALCIQVATNLFNDVIDDQKKGLCYLETDYAGKVFRKN